jgi:hypothetical protein
MAMRQGSGSRPSALGENVLDFQLVHSCWTTKAQLSGWVGYQARNGPYGSISSDSPSDGWATIAFVREGSDESPPTEQERAAVQWVIDHEAEVASAVLEGLLAEYPRLQQIYGYEGAEREEYMPNVSSTEDFRH